MCGINGCLHNEKINFSMDDFIIQTDYMKNRGPDQFGYEEHDITNKKVKLGHRRLSILDLNISAKQPMLSYNNRFSIIFNGEIYNHKELRNLIQTKTNINWKTTSDTETLINLFEYYKVIDVLQLISGMFAFAVLDKHKNLLYLARDRSGEKPFYISCGNNFFSFSSDLISQKYIPSFDNLINKLAVEKYLQFNYIPTPLTIFQHSFKLPAASLLCLDLDKFSFNKYNDFYSLTKSKGITFETWWSVPFLSNTRKNKLNYSNTKQTIKRLLKKSVKDQLLSDAPLGAFLSGGIDSSLIVSIMKQYDTNTKTFTIGFENNEYDESVEAKNIANYLGTDHTEYLFSNDSVIKMIPKVSHAFSEPFADSSQIPTMLVSNIASQKVKVALSGDGGDELFCGYNRYLYAHKYWKIIKILPFKLRIKLIKLIRLIPSKIYTRIILLLLPKITGSNFNHVDKILDKLIKIKDMKSYYQTMTTEWNSDDNIMDFSNFEINESNVFEEEYFLDSMMLNDFKAYLCDDILCKVDRSSMYYGLEVRAPYLMFELIEEAFSLPIHFKIKNNTTKYILRDILKDYLPEKFIDKPKRGFSMPISSWMKNELRDWTNDYLSKSNNSKHGFFNQDVIDKIKDQHFSNTYNHEHKLWSIIQFNSWYLNNYN